MKVTPAMSSTSCPGQGRVHRQLQLPDGILGAVVVYLAGQLQQKISVGAFGIQFHFTSSIPPPLAAKKEINAPQDVVFPSIIETCPPLFCRILSSVRHFLKKYPAPLRLTPRRCYDEGSPALRESGKRSGSI